MGWGFLPHRKLLPCDNSCSLSSLSYERDFPRAELNQRRNPKITGTAYKILVLKAFE